MIAEICQAVGFDLPAPGTMLDLVRFGYFRRDGSAARTDEMRTVARNCVKMCPRLGIQTLAGNLCIAENGHMETITMATR